MAKVMWEAPFLEALKKDSVNEMLEVLNQEATHHANTPNTAVKSYALKLIRDTLQNSSEKMYQLGMKLASSDHDTAHELGAIILGEHYSLNPDEITGVLYRLADSPNWEVREWVASACGQVLEENFESFYPQLMNWASDSSAKVRRAAALAAMYAGRSRNPSFAEPLLDLMESLLSDSDPYVKKNLGPFAIGAGLLKYYPSEVLSRLNKWSEQNDEQTRCNVAMVFSAAEGAKHVDQGLDILKKLMEDPRKNVQKAVATAMKNLNRRVPEKLKSGR